MSNAITWCVFYTICDCTVTAYWFRTTFLCYFFTFYIRSTFSLSGLMFILTSFSTYLFYMSRFLSGDDDIGCFSFSIISGKSFEFLISRVTLAVFSFCICKRPSYYFSIHFYGPRMFPLVDYDLYRNTFALFSPLLFPFLSMVFIHCNVLDVYYPLNIKHGFPFD